MVVEPAGDAAETARSVAVAVLGYEHVAVARRAGCPIGVTVGAAGLATAPPESARTPVPFGLLS